MAAVLVGRLGLGDRLLELRRLRQVELRAATSFRPAQKLAVTLAGFPHGPANRASPWPRSCPRQRLAGGASTPTLTSDSGGSFRADGPYLQPGRWRHRPSAARLAQPIVEHQPRPGKKSTLACLQSLRHVRNDPLQLCLCRDRIVGRKHLLTEFSTLALIACAEAGAAISSQPQSAGGKYL
jgi:hypothetical protein